MMLEWQEPVGSEDVAVIMFEEELDQNQLDAFLAYVAQGRQDEAEAMLKQNPQLSLGYGSCSNTGQLPSNVTVFQYALWFLDRRMWEMILPYLNQVNAQAARNQCEAQRQTELFKERIAQRDELCLHLGVEPLCNVSFAP